MLNSLYTVAKENNIAVIDLTLGTKAPAMSIMDDDGDCCIGIDYNQIINEADEAVKISHELGHCILQAFYNKYSELDIRSKHERKAWVWAIKKLIPEDCLNEAVAQGHTEMWELTEYFGYPQDFVEMAVNYYNNIE